MKKEIFRKLFHLLALIYVAGAVYLPRRIFLVVLVGLFLVDLTTELLRFRNPRFADFFQKNYGGLIRPEESQKFTAVFWMLLGVFVAAVLIGPPRVLITIYLFLILGDSAASLIGKSVGGPKWPGSPKRVSGSFACFLVCLSLAAFFLGSDYSYPALVVASLAATLFEFGILSWNDNLTIPLGTSLVFLVLDRLPFALK